MRCDGTHGVEVVGIFFFDDNIWALREGDPIGERLAKVAKETGMLIMACDNCAIERNLAKGEPRWCDPKTGEGRTESTASPSAWWKAPQSAASPTSTPPFPTTRPTR